mgnify:CR=1 FL=1
MKRKVFILENEENNIIVYKLILRDFDLIIKDNLEDAITYIKSDKFDSIEIAILDINLGDSLRIGGFNAAYQIIKKTTLIPIIICSAYTEESRVRQNAARINALLLKKPVEESIIESINDLIENNHRLKVNDIEQAAKEFITGAAYLKCIIENDFTFSVKTLERLDYVQKIENKLISNFNIIKDSRTKNEKIFKTEKQNSDFIEKFKDDLTLYVETLLLIVDSTMYNQLNISQSEIEFIEEISSTGNFILNNIGSYFYKQKVG